MTAITLAPAPISTSLFERYRLDSWPRGVVWMAQLTADTAGLIAAEPGVLLRRRGSGWEVFSRGAFVPVAASDYIVRFGGDPWCTAVVGAADVGERYSRV